MRPTAVHSITQLFTCNVTASPEVGLWKKIMKQTLNLKLKVTKSHSTVLLLSKLRQKNLGTNEIEQFMKKIQGMI